MFVTFEGLDGSGKTTQIRLLARRLEADGRRVLATREPGGTELGEQIRDLVLHGGDVAPWAEAALYAASRAQHVEEVIRPALARGEVVLCDRYIDSSVAYQGVARGLGLERVLELNLAVVGGLLPDLTFLLVLDPHEVGARLLREHDRLEREARERPTHPDLYLLEPLGEMIRIDDIRELRHDLHMRPFEADRRVYVLLDAHLLNEDAADALLKDLEEPPGYAVIVLVADELGSLPETIRSRCQLVPFRRLSDGAVRDWLVAEAPALDDTTRATVARSSGGRLDRARRLLDPDAAE